MSFSSLKNLFDNQEFYILSDNYQFIEYCKEKNLRVMEILSLNKIPKNSVGFSFSSEASTHVFNLTKNEKDIKHIFLSMNVFEPDIQHAIYNLEMISKCDFIKSLEKQKEMLDVIKKQNTLEFTGEGSKGLVKIIDKNYLIGINEWTKSSYFILSVADFFEVYFAHTKIDLACPFHLEGTLQIKGMIASLRPNGQEPYANSKNDIQKLIKEINDSNKTIIKVEDNHISSFMIDKMERVEEIKKFTGRRGLKLSEFAVGLNQEANRICNFAFNSQLNEGVNGIHIGIGDAVSGYHLDFIAPDVYISSGI